MDYNKTRLRTASSVDAVKALRVTVRTFFLVYGIKAGIHVLVELIPRAWAHVTRPRKRDSMLSPDACLEDSAAIVLESQALLFRRERSLAETLKRALFHVAAFRTASAAGLFFGSYALLRSWRAQPWVAGFLAGFATTLEKKSHRTHYAQQAAARAFQGTYNALKKRGVVHFSFGDVALFSVCCAQISYAFALYPSALEPSFYSFMLKFYGAPESGLTKNRKNIRALQELQKKPDLKEKQQQPLPCVTCADLHPGHRSCVRYAVLRARRAFLRIFPAYLALHLVPAAVLKRHAFYQSPLRMTATSTRNAARSSAFLACYVVALQVQTCMHRELIRRGVVAHDRPWHYAAMGAVGSAAAIMVEAKPRRGELALYVAPKAVAALHTILRQKEMVTRTPGLDVVSFCVASAAIMHLFSRGQEHLSPALARVLRHFAVV